MKVSVNDSELFTLTEIQENIIKDNVSEDIFDADMKRRLQWILMHKYEECYKAVRQEWEPKLIAAGVTSFPTNPDQFAALVFSQPDYKSRKQRDSEIQAE